MTNVRIPASLDDARSRLEGLDELVTAKEWARAALVFAYTREGKAGRPSENRADLPDSRLSFTAFAALGIAGLSSHHTVERYHRHWAFAVEQGAAEPATPGAAVELPEIDWPQDAIFAKLGPERKKALEGVPGASKIADVITNPSAVREAILRDPALREVARDAYWEHERNVGNEVKAVREEERAARQREQNERDASGEPRMGRVVKAHPEVDLLRFDLLNVRNGLQNVAGRARDAVLSEQEREFLLRYVDTVGELVELVRMAIQGGAVDWDEAVGALLSQEEPS